MRPGVRLCLDLGLARIGVAACDREAIMAHPVVTVTAGDATLSESDRALPELLQLVADYQPLEVLVGLPRSLNGQEGPAAVKVRAQAQALAAALVPYEVGVRLVDERFSTTTASRQMRAAGRKAKKQRSVIDQAAAVEILAQALEVERATHQPPGEAVSVGAAG